MYIIISLMVILFVTAFVISFVIARKRQNGVVSDSSPFSFADDMLIINTGTIFSVQGSSIECIELQYNPKAMQNRFYDMKIHIVKTDGSNKNISYRGSRGGAQPQEMAADLMTHRIKCVVKN